MALGISWLGKTSSQSREKKSKDKTGKEKTGKEKTGKDKAGKERSKKIEKALSDDRKKQEREIKLLLLGAGDSGKSTIVKQMRIIHKNGFDDQERRSWKNIIFHNLIDAFLEILDIMQELEEELQDPDHRHIRLLFEKRDIGLNEDIPEEYHDCFTELWKDPTIQITMLKGHKWALHDNLFYFLENLDRLFKKNYVPTNSDILRAKSRTAGISETLFDLGGFTYRMVDVGGQRSERKKWIHAFDNVQAVLFVVAISGYDMCLVEDRDQNQMDEALSIFKQIANSVYFKNSSMILFLNKMDLLEERLRGGMSPIRRYDRRYNGDPADVEAGKKYFADRFKRLYHDTENALFIHFTNATDANLLDVTMKSVQNTILNNQLKSFIL